MRTRLPITKGTQHVVIDDVLLGWRVWLHTRDYKYGTYAVLFPNGTIQMHICEPDGEEIHVIKPPRDNDD